MRVSFIKVVERRIYSLLTLLLALAFISPVKTLAADPEVALWLEILHNNGARSRLINAGSGLEDFGGVARFSTVLWQLRNEAWQLNRMARRGAPQRGVIVVSSGDNFLTGPEFNASLEAGVPFFDSIAVSRFLYDAVSFGNHEFDFGPDILADFIEGTTLYGLRFVSANLDFSGEPRLQELVNNYRIGTHRTVRWKSRLIGIVGATTDNLQSISSPRNVVANAAQPAVQAEIDALQNRGVDIIMVMSHLQNLDQDIALASQLSGVDVMIAGGSDEVLANTGDLLVPGDVPYGPYPLVATNADGKDVPVVTTGGNYKYVGRLVVGFDAHGNVVEIDHDRSLPVRVAGGSNPDAVDPDPLLEAFVVQPVADSVAGLATNVIGTSDVQLDARRSEVRSRETNMGNLVADAQLWQAIRSAADYGAPVPDVAVVNGGAIRSDELYGPGDITEQDTFDILPFADFVTIVPAIPRSQFKEIMENAVSQVLSGFGTGRFAQVAGFSMAYDADGTAQELDPDGNVVTAGTRVVDITLDDGTPIVSGGAVVPGGALNIATLDFLARGGDQYPFRGAPFTSVGVPYRQALEDYIEMAIAGTIAASQYPEGGEGRITRIN